MATATKPKGAALAPFPGGFPGLFKAYGQALADHVAHAFRPQYRLEPPTAFLDRIRRLGRAPFPAQIQAAAALATRLEDQHAAMLVGEASVGKTQIALTTAAMLGVRSVLIVAASNLLSQWQDEIRAVLPKARVYTDLTSISAVERTLGQINASQDLSIVLLARDQAKLGGPWRPSALEIAAPPPTTSRTGSTTEAPYCLGCRKVLLRVLTATYLGKDGQDRRATKLLSVPVHRLAPGALAYCPDCRRVAMDVHVTEPAPATWLACSRCRAALATVHVERKPDPNTRRVVETPKTVDMWTASYLEAGRRRCPACGDACWQSTRTLHGRAMFSIAKYLARRHPDTFGLLLMDECFPEGTMVATPAGPIPIQDLRPGDLVLSYKDGHTVGRRVVRTIKKRLKSCLVRVGHEYGAFRCTANHRIHTARGYVPAADLRLDDILTMLEGQTYADRDKNVSGMWINIPVPETNRQRRADLRSPMRCETAVANAHTLLERNIDRHKGMSGLRDNLCAPEAVHTRTTDVQPIVRSAVTSAQIFRPPVSSTKATSGAHEGLRTLPDHLPPERQRAPVLQQELQRTGPVARPGLPQPSYSTAPATEDRQAAPLDHAPCTPNQPGPRYPREIGGSTSRPTFSRPTVPPRRAYASATTSQDGDWLEYGVYDPNGQLVMAVRDCRPCSPTTQDRDRVRRAITSWSAQTQARPAQDEDTSLDRVDRAAFLEQRYPEFTGPSTRANPHHGHSAVLSAVPERNTRGGYVYDLEVEDTHCYFAAGILVSNCHDYKAGETANGMMLTDLTRTSRRVLGLTATISGGKPSTMFYLLHRLLPSFRRAWPYTAATRFAREHGLAEVLSEQQTHKSTDKSGKITSRTTVKRTMRELPGISPTILRYVLDSAVFLTLRDLGVEMPPYTEEAVEIDMLPEQAREYEALVTQLAPHLKAGLRLRRLKALGTALQALLTYPDQPWRGEAVTHHKTGELVASAPALDPNVQYPKEAELLRMCRRETGEGRRVLVYVTHTDRRDILPRLETVLREGGLRTKVLRADTVTPRKRAQWVRGHAADVDVLVTHPKLVGTGLNIPEFHTIIWYEPEWSAYTLRQASRRTWRIGQDKPVRVYFLVYAKTAQQAALALVSRKILASLLVEGQVETDHAIATYDAGGEIFYELAKAVLDRTQISDVHETLRTLSQAQTRAQELCDTTLTAKPVIVPGPTPVQTAPRRRTIAVTAPLRGEQTLLFDFAS